MTEQVAAPWEAMDTLPMDPIALLEEIILHVQCSNDFEVNITGRALLSHAADYLRDQPRPDAAIEALVNDIYQLRLAHGKQRPQPADYDDFDLWVDNNFYARLEKYSWLAAAQIVDEAVKRLRQYLDTMTPA